MPRDRAPPKDHTLLAAFEQAAFEERTAHMPATIGAAVPYYRDLLARHHAAVIGGDEDSAQRIQKEAYDLAVRLNGGTTFGIKAGEDSPANRLEGDTAAAIGDVPLWGQAGGFTVLVRDIPVRAEFDGLYGIGFPSFSAHAVDYDKPFISETGYRSFLGYSHRSSLKGVLPDAFVRACIDEHIAGELKGQLLEIAPRYRDRFVATAGSSADEDCSMVAAHPDVFDDAVSTGSPHQETVSPVEADADTAPDGGFVLSQDFNSERTTVTRNKSPPDSVAKLVASLAHRHSAWQVFADFCEMGAISISNAIDKPQASPREARYMEVVRRYEKHEVETFPQMLAALTMALEDEMGDVLGRTFHELELHNKWAGQFFSPYPLCRMMADMTLGDAETLRTEIEARGFITASEPAVGSGAMVIAMADAMKSLGINYQQHMHVTAVDVDVKCVHMAYLQLSLLHVPAVIVHGNTLSMEEWSHWYTPAHIMGGWRYKLQRAEGEGKHDVVAAPPEVPREPQAQSQPERQGEPPPDEQQLTLF